MICLFTSVRDLLFHSLQVIVANIQSLVSLSQQQLYAAHDTCKPSHPTLTADRRLALAMKFIPLLVLHGSQVLLSLNAAYYSYTAIHALEQVKGTAETMAKISSDAAESLRLTRSTETAGALAVCIYCPRPFASLFGVLTTAHILSRHADPTNRSSSRYLAAYTLRSTSSLRFCIWLSTSS